jgi:glycine oxidase
MSSSSDVLIVGGGVIGLTTAYFLAQRGISVQVVDRVGLGTEASWAGAGIIPPGNPARAGTPFDRLRAFSTHLYPSFIRELTELTHLDTGFNISGGIEFFGDERERHETVSLWDEEGIDFEPLSTERLASLASGVIPPCPHGFYLPSMGQVRNPWLMRAIVVACENVGVRLRTQTPITFVDKEGDRILSVGTENGERLTAGRFLFSAGAWMDKLLQPLGLRTSIYPVRGQIVLFQPKKPVLKQVVIVGKRYLVARLDGRVLAGATEEPERGFDKYSTPEGVEGLVQFATDLVPALREAEIEKTWVGLRPGSVDGYPYLGELPGLSNAWMAGGHFRAGIQLAPGTATIMTALLTDQPSPLPIDLFRVGRSPLPPQPSAFRS